MPDLRRLSETAIGTIELAVNDDGLLIEILLPNRRPFARSSQPSSPAAARTMRVVKRQLEEYFTGRRTIFDLPLQFSGSPFERRVWARLLEIPYGVTTSYGAIATELGLINGARAVGRANGAKSYTHRDPMPSRDRIGRPSDGIRRRLAVETQVARTRRRARIAGTAFALGL